MGICLLGGRRASASCIMCWLWLDFMYSGLVTLPGACEVVWIEVYACHAVKLLHAQSLIKPRDQAWRW